MLVSANDIYTCVCVCVVIIQDLYHLLKYICPALQSDVTCIPHDTNLKIMCVYTVQCQISHAYNCLLYTSPSPRDATLSRMPSSA